ncbi:hypothetical protein FRC12_002201 [Ceratobasidium sp. 428]|nr:hypothetical protein FRC12_002201 [Ceratobasidium sp. 428]
MDASRSQHQDACFRALQIPELYHMIFSLLEKKDYAKFLYVSRSTFTLMLPMIWGEADFRDILRLIPGVTITSGKIGCSSTPEYTFTLPSVIDLSRVRVYSPVVETLTTAGSYIVRTPHEALKSMTRAKARPLLPNLRRLVIKRCGIAKPEHFAWIPMILHPGLLSLEMYMLRGGYVEAMDEIHAWLNRDICFGLIDQLTRTCPRLENLHLFPSWGAIKSPVNHTSIYTKAVDLVHLIRSFKSGKTAQVPVQILGRLTFLRSLTFSGAMVHQELFLALGQLPHLETLSLRTDESQFQEKHQEPIIIPNNSFPSLRQLDLYQLNEYTMSRICNIAPLFYHLVSASIMFNGKPSWYDNYYSNHIDRSEVPFACLGANSPHVERLTVLPHGYRSSEVKLSWSIVDKLKRMPLRYLRVGTIELGPDSSSNFTSEAPQVDWPHRWEDFLSAVSQLEELRMDTKHVSLDELWLIGSRLPKLSLLVFWQVDLRRARAPTETINATQSIVLRSWSYFGADIAPGCPHGFWAACIPDTESSICNAARFVASLPLKLWILSLEYIV